MLFKAPVLTAIAEGQVTLAFRRWRKPTVRAGGTLTTPIGVLAIDEVEIVSPDVIDRARPSAPATARSRHCRPICRAQNRSTGSPFG